MYSGFVIALALMIFATLYKQRATRIALGIMALFFLMIQGGCWQLSRGIDEATNGKVINNYHIGIVIVLFVICMIWTTILIKNCKSAK